MGLVRLSLAKIWGERVPSIIVRYHEHITNIKEGVPKDPGSRGMPSFFY